MKKWIARIILTAIAAAGFAIVFWCPGWERTMPWLFYAAALVSIMAISIPSLVLFGLAWWIGEWLFKNAFGR